MKRSLRTWPERCLLVLTFFCLTVLPDLWAGAQASAQDNEAGISMVEIRNGRISVSAKEVPLEVLCKDIETKSGVRFNIESALVGKKLSTEFKNLSLLKGIKRLLARMNYMICFDELNKLSEVFIVRRSEPNPLPVMRRYTPPRGGAGIRRPLNRGLP